MADKDEEFETGEAGSSLTYPVQCSSLRKNGFVLMKGRPCKIVEMSTSKTGKHGHAKVNMTGIDIFTAKKYEDCCPSTHNMEVPVVKRQEYELQYVDPEGFLSLFHNGEVREDIRIPNSDLGKEITNAFDNLEDGQLLIISVVSAMNEEYAVSFRTAVDKEKEGK